MAEYVGLTIGRGTDLLNGGVERLFEYAGRHQAVILGLLVLLVLWNLAARSRA